MKNEHFFCEYICEDVSIRFMKMMFGSTFITTRHQLIPQFVIFFIVIVCCQLVSCNHPVHDDQIVCTIDHFQGCLKLLGSVGGEESDLALPVTELELKSACSDLKIGLVCLDEHIQKCFNEAMQQVYVNVATGAKNFIDDLCDNQTVQREYLRHSQCFRNVSVDEQKCGNKYKEAGESANLEGLELDKIDQIDTETIMKKSCCALLSFVQCKETHVRQDCGERASSFMRKHLHRITNPIMDQHCSAYTFGPNACSQRDVETSNAINVVSGVRLVVVALTLLPLYANYCFI